jgi:hypothetical protein
MLMNMRTYLTAAMLSLLRVLPPVLLAEGSRASVVEYRKLQAALNSDILW